MKLKPKGSEVYGTSFIELHIYITGEITVRHEDWQVKTAKFLH